MNRLLHRPRPDEATIPVAKSPANTPSRRPAPGAHLRGDDRDRQLLFDDLDEILDGPAHMPDKWQPARSGSELDHASVRAAMDELLVDAGLLLPRYTTSLTKLTAMLNEPLPPWTDRAAMLPAIWSEVDWDLGVAVDAATTEALSGIYNSTVRHWFDSTREVVFGARELCEQLVNDVARNIADLIVLAEVAV